MVRGRGAGRGVLDWREEPLKSKRERRERERERSCCSAVFGAVTG